MASPEFMASPERPPPRLFMVSNKTPVTIKRVSEGLYNFSQGSGGLVTGLSGLSRTIPYTSYGWPGLQIPEKEQAGLSSRLRDECATIPVFLPDEIADPYYNGFNSNVTQDSHSLTRANILSPDSIIWPIFHYHPGEMNFSEEAWSAYVKANRKFAITVAKDVKDGDLVWIHDFHLFLLPSMLREEVGPNVNIKIGFFLHTTFPSSEVYRIIPVRNELLLGVLHSDLIGFHTNTYARHFLSSCSRVL